MTYQKKENPVCSGAGKYSRHKSINSQSFRQLDFKAINAAALSVLPALVVRWLPDGLLRGHEYIARNPRRADRQAGSFSINIRTGKWADFASGDSGGDVISLAAYLFGKSQRKAADELAMMLGMRHEQ